MSVSRKTISINTSATTFIKVRPASDKNDNLISSKLIKILRFAIFLEAFMGINRVYLLPHKKIISIFFNFISVIYVLLFIILFSVQFSSQDYFILYEQTLIVEFSILCICSFHQKKKLTKVFKYLALFDEKCNISNDVYILTSPKISVYVIIIGLVYYLSEALIIWIFLPQVEVSAVLVNFIIFSHVTEQVFFCTAMKVIFKRLSVLKAHVEMILKKVEKRNKVESLCENVHLDIEDIHKAYDLLHRCGKKLNSAMNIPMVVMILASCVATVVLLKNFIQYLIFLQHKKEVEFSRAAIFFITERSIQYMIHIFAPSLYASFTYNQVTHIRKVLGEALSTNQMGLIERRKLKAFFLLTQVDDFAYTLLGFIRLDMTIPVSYVSICITYFIIAMQFSKFGD